MDDETIKPRMVNYDFEKVGSKMIKNTNSDPLFVFDKGGPYNKHILKYYGFEPPKSFDLSNLYFSKRIKEKKYDIIFGIKALPDDFTKYDFLCCYDGAPMIVHRRVLDVLKNDCPGEFQAFSVVIKNFDKNDSPFENHDYYAINVLNNIDCIDRDKSDLFYRDEECLSQDRFEIKRLVFKKEGMEPFRLAYLHGTRQEIIHPSLAAKLKKCKGVEFRSADEAYPRRPTPGEFMKYRYEEGDENSLEALRRLMISVFNTVELKRFHETYKPDQEEAVRKGIELLKERSKMYDAECSELITFMESKR
ncbi:MAG: hypothetical protein KBE16_01540 [Alphaproteobacteria bacterium]|nr:hypothetical protein [Alphaproteobacteria bacterium]MBP9877691.1 hypothetical protein [Alphaproteobacteria bacterium]